MAVKVEEVERPRAPFGSAIVKVQRVEIRQTVLVARCELTIDDT